jgi:hypothetical protein
MAMATAAAPALGAFPYTRPGADPRNYQDLYLTSQVPNDVGDDDEGEYFKYSASPLAANLLINVSPVELGGVRGAHVLDRNTSLPTAWQITTGRPDVTIAVMDSGIKWNETGAMNDLRLKTRLNRGELPLPQSGVATCSAYDCNVDGVFNVADYAGDPRVDLSDPRRVGPDGVLVPQDLLLAFSDGTDADGNGYVDDIAGWDFLDDDNDAFDDVQYGHGTGEAEGSTAEADNGGTIGTCANCMSIPMRVGDSFIADVNRFAQAVLYAADNDVQVVQSALGTLNNSSLARTAVEYAYRHGTTMVLSAADEAAQHNNQPYLPHTILVNSVTRSPIPPPNQSYLALNGCTNFNAKITLAIPSTSCSSDAVGLASGFVGLIYSAAYTAAQKGALAPFDQPALCELVRPNPITGDRRCLITPNEVRQVLASGRIGVGEGTSAADGYQPDDVNFAGLPPQGAEPSCSPVPAPGCTDPNGALQAQVNANRSYPTLPSTRSYPARKGHDQFYGYGRAQMRRAVAAVLSSPTAPGEARIPPSVEIRSPEWNQQVDPAAPTLAVSGEVYARGTSFTCQVYVAPGHYPNNRLTTETPPGDFAPVGNGPCDGQTAHSGPLDGVLGTIGLEALRGRFPPETQATGFTGREPGGTAQTANGRPNTDPYGFVVKVVATATRNDVRMTGEDQRATYLHRDQDMLAGFPRGIVREAIRQGQPTGDGASSPVLADLDGDNRNELVLAGSDGFVHALRRDGSELPGWPVRGDRPPLHLRAPGFASGEVSSDVGGAILASVAVADANRDGIPEVFAADLEGKVYGWNARGRRIFAEQANIRFSGRPLAPFENVRFEAGDEGQSELRRTQHGFIASPVIADLDGRGGLEVIAAGMDRHVYAWHINGSRVRGFPTLVVDRAKVASIDPATHAVTFKPDSGALMQGAIIDTPALADIAGDGRPEIVVGTNEEYEAERDGGLNAGRFNTASYSAITAAGEVLSPGNSRLYVIRPDGEAGPDGDAYLPGWPAKIGILNTELLPVVGEGISGYPVVAPATCPSGGAGPKIAVLANNGPAYLLNPSGDSCYGKEGGQDIALASDVSAGPQLDRPLLPAVGHPAFGDLGDGLSVFAPAAGLQRALDVVLPEYQVAGQDFLAAWSVAGGGQIRPNFPQPVNDLQFLTGPSVADLDGLPGQEVVEGTASKDLAAFNAAGAPVNPRWPKLSSDWTVANPTIGSFGSLDTEPGARKVVIGLTRSGYVNAYATDAPACSPSSWPRFHHDNANSGDLRRDATLPGKPTGLRLAAPGRLRFTSPGDDLMCGRVRGYQIATSPRPIDESSFGGARRLGNAPGPVEPGETATYKVPESAERFVAVRAVDNQGNVGRVAAIAVGAGGGGGGAGGACANREVGTHRSDRMVGTGAGDALIGRRGRDLLLGRRGADCLRGNGGADRLSGGRAPDRLLGGIDQDRLHARDGVRDVVNCGRGRRDRAVVDRRDRVRGCERVRRPRRR